ncbi:MAG: hypothetical protein ABSD29_02495 [Verrucomicrobiota bacterium]
MASDLLAIQPTADKRQTFQARHETAQGFLDSVWQPLAALLAQLPEHTARHTCDPWVNQNPHEVQIGEIHNLRAMAVVK